MVKFKSKLSIGAINGIIWGCIVLLSVANGYIWYSEIPNSYVLGVILACVGLIVLHRYFTRKWCDDRDNGNYRDYDEELHCIGNLSIPFSQFWNSCINSNSLFLCDFL